MIGSLLRGLALAGPLGLTLMILAWGVGKMDGIFERLLGRDVPTGVGAVGVIAVLILIGATSRLWGVRTLIQWAVRTFETVPLVRTIHGTLKDTLQFVVGEKKTFSKVALVRVPESNMRLLGFITREQVREFEIQGGVKQKYVAVWLPMSYQLGGYMVLVPEKDVEYVNAPGDDTFRFVLSAGVSG